MHDAHERMFVERLMIGVFILLSLIAGPAIALATYHR
jgi:hypothetical protein